MSYTLNTSPKLPPGALVSVWARSAFTGAVSGSPPASPVFTGVMGRYSLSVPGLSVGQPYVAHASVGGLDRYTEFFVTVGGMPLADLERAALRPSGVVWEAWPRTQSINAAITVAAAKETVWAVWVPSGLTVTGMRFYANSTAATAPTHQFFTVRNFATLALIKQTTDDTSTAWSASSSKSLSWLGGGSWVTTAGLYYFGFAFSGTTPPTLTGLGFNSALAAVAPIPVATTGDTISTGTAPDPASAVTSSVVGRAYFELLG